MSIEKDKLIKVWNRGAGEVGYDIPDLRMQRNFATTGTMIEIPFSELQALQYARGGRKLMEKYLLIKEQDVCAELGLPQDPEYFYDENDIKVLLTEGTEDQLLDCLEFAPKGVLDLVKKIAVETKLDSSRKRKLISEHLKVNIDAMITINEQSKEEGEEEGSATRERRSTPITSEKKTETSKYNVVNRATK